MLIVIVIMRPHVILIVIN